MVVFRMKNLTGDDYRMVLQPKLEIHMRFEIYDRKDNYVNTIGGYVTSGTGTIDAESDVRRTFSINLVPDYKSKLIIDEQGYIWIDKFIYIYIGLEDLRNGEIREWKFGKFVFTNTNTTYDPVSNQMSINCSDLMAFLDGSKNGELGQYKISFPAYEENEEGIPTKYNTIRAAVIDTVSQLGRINDIEVDDIGEYNAMPLYNENYREYRYETMQPLANGDMQETWNTIPFDQEFTSGTTVLNIITTFRDLYPNYEAYFNENGTFCMNMIPSGDEDPVIIEDEFFQEIYISENTSFDMTQVRNVSHVWGQVIETDFYTEDVDFNKDTYVAKIEGYKDGYKNGDTIAMKMQNASDSARYYAAYISYTDNTYRVQCQDLPDGSSINNKDRIIFQPTDENTSDGTKFQIVNKTDALPILNFNGDEEISAGTFEKDKQYVLEYRRENDNLKLYYVGLKGAINDGLFIQVIGHYLKEDTDETYETVTYDRIPIYDDNTEDFLSADKIESDNVYAFKIKSKYVGGNNEFRAYWLGSYQVEGLCALVQDTYGGNLIYVNTTYKEDEPLVMGYFCLEDGEFYAHRERDERTGKYVYTDKCPRTEGIVYYQEDIDTYYRLVHKYSKEYFENVYACKNVRLKIIPQSPFTCQKIGEYLSVMNDEKNITSTSLAVSRADWEVYKMARLPDSITLTTTLCPFADVNIKVTYRRHDLNRKNPYIVKNVSHDFSGGTTTWQLMRFYPLYERLNKTHEELHEEEFTHDDLSLYTHERI